ncbi:MAG: chromate transporter [Myxococcota bacterium]
MLLSLFLGFARVGLLGFGGGPSMLPLLQAECVGNGWLTDEEFLEGLAVGSVLPGPITTKMAVYVGWHQAGALGATSAALGIVLPSAVLMATIGAIVLRYREHPIMHGALNGVKPAVVGMLAFVAWDLAPTAVVGGTSAALALAAFVALAFGKVHPGLVIVAAAALGAVIARG